MVNPFDPDKPQDFTGNIANNPKTTTPFEEDGGFQENVNVGGIFLNVKADANTLPNGTSATAEYNPANFTFTFGIPEGSVGPAGTQAIGKWQPDTIYAQDDTIWYDDKDRIYKSINNQTSGATFDPTLWTELSRFGDIREWQASTLYRAGETVYEASTNRLYLAVSAFTSGATFNILNWIELSKEGIKPFESDYPYLADDLIWNIDKLYKAKIGFTSSASFDLADWLEVSKATINSWLPDKDYVADDVVYEPITNILYRSTGVFTSGATFDSNNWIQLKAGGGVAKWEASTQYFTDDVVWEEVSLKIYKADSDFVSGGSFNIANWTQLSRGVLPVASSTDNAIVRWDGTTGEQSQDSLVTISDTGLLENVEDIINQAGVSLTRLIRNDSATGVISGLQLTVGVGNTVDISAGRCRFVDNSDPLNPTGYELDVGPFNGVPLLNPIVAGITYFTVDGTGTLLSSNTVPTRAEIRAVCFLGFGVHFDGSGNLLFVSNRKVPSVNQPLNVIDLATAIGSFNRDGNLYQPIPASKTFSKTSGNVFSIGANIGVDINDPNNLSQSADALVSFSRAYGDEINGYNADPVTTTLITNEWWDKDAGAFDSVSGNNWAVHRIYLGPINNLTSVVVGQNEYSTYDDALAGIGGESVDVNPNIVANSVLRGYIVARGGSVDFSDPADAVFVEASKFGGAGGSSAPSSPTDLQGAYDNSANPEITLDAVRGAFSIRDNLTPVGALFELQDNAGSDYFSVTPTETALKNNLELDNGGSAIIADAQTVINDHEGRITVNESNIADLQSASTGSLDLFNQQTFEDGFVVGDIQETGNGVYGSGGVLVGTLEMNMITPIAGTQSLKYTQILGSTGDYVKIESISLDPKQGENLITMVANYSYLGADNESLKIVIKDETNDVLYDNSSFYVSNSDGLPNRFTANVTLASCQEISYGFIVESEEVGAEFRIDDIEFKTSRDDIVEFTVTNSIGLEGSDGRTLTIDSESIPFDGVGTQVGWVEGIDGSTPITGNYYEVQYNNSVLTLSGSVGWSPAATNPYVTLMQNGSAVTIISQKIATSDIAVDFSYTTKEGQFSKGDKIAFTGRGGTLTSSTAYHRLNIVETAQSSGTVFASDTARDGVGEIVAMPTDEVPKGFLKADGAVVSRTIYAELFSVIGETYGAGDGSTTFQLPNLEGQFLRGDSSDSSVDPDGPRAVGSSQTDAFASHNHDLSSTYISSDSGSVNDTTTGLNATPRFGIMQNLSIGFTGSDETRPKNIAVNWCIRYESTLVSNLIIENFGNVVAASSLGTGELENVFSGKVSNNGTATVINSTQNFITTSDLNRTGTGVVVVDYSSLNLSNAPAITAIINSDNNRYVVINNITNTSATFYQTSSGGIATDGGFDFTLTLQGSDYKSKANYIDNLIVENPEGEFETEFRRLTADVSSDNLDITDLHFSGLEVGAKYLLTGQVNLDSASNSNNQLRYFSGSGGTGTQYGVTGHLESSSSYSRPLIGVSQIIDAVSTDLYARHSGTLTIYAGATRDGTFLELTKLPKKLGVDQLGEVVTNHVTGGTEYEVKGKLEDGKQVYRRYIKASGPYSTTTTFISGLPVGINVVETGMYSETSSGGGSLPDYVDSTIAAYSDYVRNSNLVRAIISGVTVVNVKIWIEYTKP